ncbi:MAG: tRNA glutamyl-Q(34) synthetase GluQRS [Planctomycetota bacterium]
MPISELADTMSGWGRLAPSPTGAQHLGNARTYLLTYWAALALDQQLVLRIEDINSPRVKPWATQQAIDDLAWLGIRWQQGPDLGGPHEPYVQSRRTKLYDAWLQQLIDRDLAYPCTCSRGDVAAAADAPHRGDHVVVYPGTCSGWHVGDSLPPQGTYSWRFRTKDAPCRFDDAIAGTQTCESVSQRWGDFPLTRKTGEVAYQLAVVVDDIEMGITQVVRGDDLITSTFWQLELYAAFDAKPPDYAHVPLVVGTDGRRLAKRHGDSRLSQYRDRGVAAQTVIAWAAKTLGLASEDQPDDSLSHQRIVDHFQWSAIRHEVAVVEDTRGFGGVT